MLVLARIGRPDILWSVNKLARSITKWTKACDKRLNRLISYIHHTSEYKQYCHVGNTAKQCRLGLFWDSDFAGDVEDSKSTSAGILCIFRSRTFVLRSWMCKKQTSVSHQKLNLFRCRLTHGWHFRSLSWIWWLKYFIPYQNQRFEKRATVKFVGNSPVWHAKIRTKCTDKDLTNWHWSRSITRNTLWIPVLCCMSVWMMRPWLR